jgi:hypothetical protein
MLDSIAAGQLARLHERIERQKWKIVVVTRSGKRFRALGVNGSLEEALQDIAHIWFCFRECPGIHRSMDGLFRARDTVHIVPVPWTD